MECAFEDKMKLQDDEFQQQVEELKPQKKK
jgi:hypothetical protein